MHLDEWIEVRDVCRSDATADVQNVRKFLPTLRVLIRVY
jgi:hypothetical protein